MTNFPTATDFDHDLIWGIFHADGLFPQTCEPIENVVIETDDRAGKHHVNSLVLTSVIFIVVEPQRAVATK